LVVIGKVPIEHDILAHFSKAAKSMICLIGGDLKVLSCLTHNADNMPIFSTGLPVRI
jgi:hypothetical protein